MPGISRFGDKTSEHSFSSITHANTTITQGSENVFINNREAVRENDPISCGDVVAFGSNNIFVNNKSCSRLSDRTKLHNAIIITASDNCFAN